MTERIEVLSRLARVVAGSDPRTPLPLRMCRACTEIVGADGGAITLAYSEPQRVTLCATDAVAARLEDLHEVVGEGPSYAAYHDAVTVVVEVDGVADVRWPQFAEAVRRELGSLAIRAVPIAPDGQVVGVSTFYRRRGTAPDPDAGDVDEETVILLVNAVGVALMADSDLLTTRLDPTSPWASRSVINQATGMVMAQLRLAPEDAIALLRAHAYASGASLDAISKQIVQRRLDFTASD